MTPLTFVMLAAFAALPRQAEDKHAADRIQQAQYCAAVELRAQHRDIERVQPVSHLEPELDAARRKAEVGRLITPEKLEVRPAAMRRPS
jgi:hypothetical protein